MIKANFFWRGLQTQRTEELSKQLQEVQVHEKSLLLEINDLKRLLAQAESGNTQVRLVLQH